MFIIVTNHKKRRKYRTNKEQTWKVHKKEADALVREIINKLEKTQNFDYGRITIRNQRTRWGSCSSRKNLNFNYRIINLPYELAEYVVVHELCHLKEMNHSKRYWELLAGMLPNYKLLKKHLRKVRIIS